MQMAAAAERVRRLNWWKIGFFVALIAFEGAREIAVEEAYSIASPNTTASVSTIQGYTFASGTWKRIDGGDPMIPTAVTIQCTASDDQCIEATAPMYERYVGAPTVDRFEATFSPDMVTYSNEDAVCVRYSVRIDLKLGKVFAVREKKARVKEDICKPMEQRIELQLADGYEFRDPTKGHFVPLLRFLGWVFA